MTHDGFWQMGGFAFYVWSVYGLAAVVFAWNIVAPYLRRRALVRELSEFEDQRDVSTTPRLLASPEPRS
ncbi:MAG TPA: heme exporter protein CcmD [Nevskiaceae bacterium]|nr:heme exporter protein CcmD [Nevskiaceae bacterium]